MKLNKYLRKKRYFLVMKLCKVILKIAKQDAEEYYSGIKEIPFGRKEHVFHIVIRD